MLTVPQHRAANRRQEMLSDSETYWPEEITGHEQAHDFMQKIAKQGRKQMNVHETAL
jgi:hypothetical protein